MIVLQMFNGNIVQYQYQDGVYAATMYKGEKVDGMMFAEKETDIHDWIEEKEN